MKQYFTILISGLILGLLACNSTVNRKESKIEKNVTIDSLQLIHDNTAKNISEQEEDIECTRGQTEPIIKKNIFPHTQFILNADSLTATEIIDFDNGDKLIINNGGCESYTLTFRFETSRFQEDTANISFWYKKSVVLISELSKGIDAPIEIKKGIDKLNHHINLSMHNPYTPLSFGQAVDFGDEEPRNIVTVENVEKLTDKKFAITISFTTGPL